MLAARAGVSPSRTGDSTHVRPPWIAHTDLRKLHWLPGYLRVVASFLPETIYLSIYRVWCVTYAAWVAPNASPFTTSNPSTRGPMLEYRPCPLLFSSTRAAPRTLTPRGPNLGAEHRFSRRVLSGVCPPRTGMGSSVRLLLCLVLVAVVAANNSTQTAQEKKDAQTQSVITMAWGIFGFFAFTSSINAIGMLYDRKMGNNKVADGGDA